MDEEGTAGAAIRGQWMTPDTLVDNDAAPVHDWVSKRDITTYYRCPYAYSLWAQGVVTREDLFDPRLKPLTDRGITFHEEVTDASAGVSGDGPADFNQRLTSRGSVLGTPVYANWELGLVGIPDGVDSTDGGQIPIEIKSHRKPTRLDELELAFYWLLLSPENPPGAQPRGDLLLSGPDGPTTRRIDITATRLQQVRELIRGVRAARTSRVYPRNHDCYFCTQVRDREVQEVVRYREDLTMIFDLGETRARDLEALGIQRHSALLTVDAAALAAQLKSVNASSRVSAQQILKWQAHARAYDTRSPQWMGAPIRLPERWVAFDLEYISDPGRERVFLAGVTIVENGDSTTTQLWADDSDDDERLLLSALHDALRTNGCETVVTWAGKSADYPTMTDAARRLEAPNPLHGLVHIDLYYEAVSRVRIPVTRMRQDDWAEYLGINPPAAGITSGWGAALAYEEYGQSKKRLRPAIRNDLMTYNQNDLDALVAIAAFLSASSP